MKKQLPIEPLSEKSVNNRLKRYEKNLTDNSVEYYENQKQKNKHIIKCFQKTLKNLMKYGFSKNNIKEFYFSCNSLGMSVYPCLKDLEQWIVEELPQNDHSTTI